PLPYATVSRLRNECVSPTKQIHPTASLPVRPWSRVWLAGRRSDGAKIVCRRLPGPSISNKLERDLLSLIKAWHPSAFDSADVHEDIPATVIRLNEAEAFLAIEPLYRSLRHDISFKSVWKAAR